MLNILDHGDLYWYETNILFKEIDTSVCCFPIIICFTQNDYLGHLVVLHLRDCLAVEWFHLCGSLKCPQTINLDLCLLLANMMMPLEAKA